MKFADLSREERAEIDALVHEAYIGDEGEIRSHADAAEHFDGLISHAVQARREWSEILLDEWRAAGMRAFVKDRWKHSEMFEFIHRGRSKQRTVRRGVKRRDDSGRQVSTQVPLWEWTADDLRAGIADAANQVAEHQTNLSLYRDMLTLIEQAEVWTFGEALRATDQTWEQWLDAREAAS